MSPRALALAMGTLLWAAAFDASVASAQIRDPSLAWRTIRTEHFEIHYHEPLGLLARRSATIAERAHEMLAEVMGFEPGGRVQMVITDDSDLANGSATALPFDVIRLYAQPPEDLSPLSDYDDWLTVLITHEHTHILHLDQASGFPSIINAILGKTYMPNHVQPRWFLEGVAVWNESGYTAAGRLRSSIWDMYLRADVLEDRVWGLDQVSTIADRWPHGNAAYVYGSYFVQYIADRHGREAIARIAREYGESVVPYGINRVALRATGRTFVELWDDFVSERRAHYREMERRIRAEGLREGERLTHHGEVARTPRYMPDGRLVYLRSDNRSRPRIVEVDRDTGEVAETFVRTTGGGEAAVHPDGGSLVYSRVDAWRDIYYFTDLFRRDLGTGHEERLTQGLRAREPDISPDGRHVVFTVSRAGTTRIVIAELHDVVGTMRELAPAEPFTVWYTPRFSPDGRTVAASVWRSGGLRDVVLIDVATGRMEDVTHDRAQDTGPVFSPDGRHLYFASDRTGVSNIYSYHLASGTLRQVTNVLMGAYQPAISPSGDELAYIGYTSFGFDLFTMAVTPEGFRPAPAYVDRRPTASETSELMAVLSEPYDPMPTLYPRSWLLDVTPDSFGPALGFTVSGEDVVGFHAWSTRVGVGLVRGNVSFDGYYAYTRTPLGVFLRGFRREALAGGLAINGEQVPWVQDAIGGDVGLSYTFPHSFRFDSIFLSYAATYTRVSEAIPYELRPDTPPPSFPTTGLVAGLRLGWSYSDVERYGYDISPSNGRRISVSASVADPFLGSQYRVLTLTWNVAQYIPMPWEGQHVLALHYAGGLGGGDFDRRGLFGVGGFPTVSYLDNPIAPPVLGGQALRGYAPNDRVGTQYHLVQAEYRFLIWRFNVGILTLPIYLNRVWATVFCDWGDAFFGEPNLERFRWGVGGELHIDFTLFYVLGFSLRVGYARGLSENGIDQVYGHLGVPF